jgi:hypothetical protein
MKHFADILLTDEKFCHGCNYFNTVCARVCHSLCVISNYRHLILEVIRWRNGTQIFNQLRRNARKKPVTLVRSINKPSLHRISKLEVAIESPFHVRTRNNRPVTQGYFKVLLTLILTCTITLSNATVTTLCFDKQSRNRSKKEKERD